MDRKQVFALYSELLDLAPEEREGRLRDLTCADQAMEREVRALLAAQNEQTFALSAPVEQIRDDYWRSVSDDDPDAAEDLSGRRFGRWALEERVGRGGLATVYRACRADGEFDQTAAFKVLRRGLDTEDLVARFRTERQILAALDHPGIAGILDGGTLPDGRPYLVLEFVNGTDLVSWAEHRHLGTQGRLELISQVAAALHHAHQRLVVHRDVKPSNVMVTEDGTVRLLDFGIARLLDPQDGPAAARLTRTGVHFLTPAYGTPEQYAGEPVTTASDVYQLGLLLGELLTGDSPAETSGGAPRPDLSRLHNRDLAAIIEKATRPEPAERYTSVLALQEDLQRFQSRRPVLARAGSWRYRVGKFFKRRPLLAPGAALAAAAVAVYVVTITSYSRDLAREQALAETTRDFLVRLFESPDPRAPADPERGRNITVVEALEIGRERLLADLADQPALEASLSRSISQVYTSLDQYQPAIELRERALRLEEDIYGADSSQSLESMRALARLKMAVGDPAAAASLSARQLELTRARGGRGVWLGLAEYAAGEHALATGQESAGAELLESAISEMLSDQRVAAGPEGESLLALLNSASSSENTVEQILAVDELVREALGADAPASLVLQAQAATALSSAGDSAAAEVRFDSLIPRMIEVLGENHPDTLTTRNNLAVLYTGGARFLEAEDLYRDLLDRSRQVYGDESASVATGYQNLATAIARQGRFGEAIPLHQRALETYVEVFAAEHPVTALPLISLSLAHLMQGDADLAEASAGAALARLEAGGGKAQLAFTAQCLLGHARLRRNEPDGEALLREARGGLADAALSGPYDTLCGQSG